MPQDRISIKLSCSPGNNSAQPSFPSSIPGTPKEHRTLSAEPNINPTLFPLELTTIDLSSGTATIKF